MKAFKLGTITDQKLARILYMMHTNDALGGVTSFGFKSKNGKIVGADIYAEDCDEQGRKILRMLKEE